MLYRVHLKSFILVANNLVTWLNVCIEKTKQTQTWFLIKLFSKNQTLFRGRCGHDHMVVGFADFPFSQYFH
jgi:hypothetical protein